MPNPHYSCPFCPKKFIDRYILSHIVKEHSKDFYNRYKHAVNVAINKNTLLSIVLACDDEKNNRLCCLGCNKLWRKPALADLHTATCEKKKEHKDALKALLSPTEETECTETSSNALVEELKKKLERTECKLKNAEEEVEDLEKKGTTFDLVMRLIHEKLDQEERDEWRDWLKSEKEDIDWEDYL